MSQNAPGQQAETTRSEDSVSQSQLESSAVALTNVEFDDNPRSPKRRRISPADGEENGDGTSKLSTAQQPSAEQKEEMAGQQQSHTTSNSTSNTTENHKDDVAGNPAALSQSAREKTRSDLLVALDRLASHILSFLSRLTPPEAMGLSNTPNAPSTREYAALRSTFDQTRRSLSPGWPFLSPKDMGLRDNNQIEIVRRANQAIFMSSVFTGEIGLRDMDRSFLAIFVPDNAKLLKAQASIYLELKTQGFITAWRTGAAPPSVVMADLFGPDLDKAILARRPGTTSLAPSEQDFLNRLTSRRDILLGHVKNNSLDQLPLKYRWEDFSREVSSYLSKHLENTSGSGSNLLDANKSDPTRTLQRGQMEGQFSIHGPPLPVSSTDSIRQETAQIPVSADSAVDQDDFVAQAARAAEIAMQDAMGYVFSEPFPTSSSPNPPPTQQDASTPQPAPPEPQNFEPILEVASSNSPVTGSSGGPGEIPHVSQTAPTSVLYERAKLAATSVPLAAKKVAGAPSPRRPWTTEEENALMTGLDQVKGPHWSQILAMYGPGGTVSEALKDRNQVQLKDKARNLKLFFLKSGIEVPYYLKYVTGDLKTRAPGQASKQEARERDRLQSEGDDTPLDDMQGLMSLEGGEQAEMGAGDFSLSPSNVGSPAAEEPKTTFEPSMADVEAMIARAAAQASQSLGPDWT